MVEGWGGRGRAGRFWIDPAPAMLLLGILHRRNDAPQVKEHPTRAALLRIVADNPGIPLNKVRSKLPLGWGTLYHHVRRLEKTGAIETVAVGRRRLLYIPGVSADEELAAQALVEGATARAIAEAVWRRPGTSFKELVEATGASERVAYYHIKRLMDARLVESSSTTRHYGLRPSPLLIRCLLRVRAAPRKSSHDEPSVRDAE